MQRPFKNAATELDCEFKGYKLKYDTFSNSVLFVFVPGGYWNINQYQMEMKKVLLEICVPGLLYFLQRNKL